MSSLSPTLLESFPFILKDVIILGIIFLIHDWLIITTSHHPLTLMVKFAPKEKFGLIILQMSKFTEYPQK